MLLRALEEKPLQLFWFFIALHFAVWTALPALVQHNAPLDVVEGFAWGRQWLLGTHKHPPLQAWMLESVGQVFGNSAITFFSLAALCVSLAQWAVYRTGLLLTGKTAAVLASMATTGILYFNFLSTEFNPNSLQLALWAWAGHYFAKACLKGNARSWIKLGMLSGAAMYAKFATAFLLLGFVLFFFSQKQTRQQLKTPWPYAAAALCILLFAPELLWLKAHDFMPLAYAKSRMVQAQGLLQNIGFQLKFLAAQLGVMALALLLCLSALWKNTRIPPVDMKQKLLLWLAFGPLALSLTLAFLDAQKMKDMWGMPFLTFIPLWLLSFLHHTGRATLKRFMAGGAALFLLTPALFVANYFYAPQLGYKPLRGHFPGPEISATLRQAWEKETGTPLAYVAGDVWLAGNVALYAPDFNTRPRVFIEGKPEINPTISLDDVRQKGMLVIWRADAEPPALPESLGTTGAVQSASFAYALQTGMASGGLTLKWAFIRPQTTP